MRADADFAGRLWRAAARRRAPLWLASALPWCLLLLMPRVPAWAAGAGMAACAALALFDARRLASKVARDWPRWLDRALPALEDSSALLADAASPIAQLQRRRLLLRAESTLSGDALRKIARIHVRPGWHLLAVGIVAALAVWGAQHVGAAGASAAQKTATPTAALPGGSAAAGAIVVRVRPPKYTGVANSEGAPRDLTVPEHSDVAWCWNGPQTAGAAIELSDGQVLEFKSGCAVWRATESLFWRWRAVRYQLRVVPDQAPQIAVTKPGEMVHVLSPSAGSAAIAVSVRDDYMVTRATLHLTLARGSGENIRFSDRELPLPASPDPRVRAWSKQWSLAELGMEPGDELYFFVRATDNAARVHLVQSPTYTLRLPGPVAQDDEASTALPMLVKPENLRSQRQIIIDTEQLVADMKATPRLGAASVRARSEAIASDQAQLRRRYGQFLGEESTLFGADEHEGEGDGDKHDVVAEFSHLHDQAESATLFDEATKKVLRRALVAMWDAEKALRAITPQPALAPEHKALEAIKELQQADRIYLHKTAFVPAAIKEELRMTGDVAGAKSYRREQGAQGEPVPGEVRELLQALGSDAPLPALWSKSAHAWIRARVRDDAQRLEAQRAVQDVADGCAACRPVLRAWLRGAITDAPVLLQAKPVVDTPFIQAWQKGAQQ